MKTFLVCLALLASACKEAPKDTKEAREVKEAAEGKGVPPPAAGSHRVELAVTEKGFEPSPVTVKAGEPLELVVTRKTEKTCATEIIVKDYGIEKKLPLNEPVLVAFTPKQAGEIKYGCGMDQMISGVITVE